MPARRLPLRALLVLLAAWGVLSIGVGLLDFRRRWIGGEYESLALLGPSYLAGLAAAALVVALAWRALHRPEARALALSLGFALLAGGLVVSSTRAAPGFFRSLQALLAPAETSLVFGASAAALAGAAFLRFTALFPRPLDGERLRRFFLEVQQGQDSLGWWDRLAVRIRESLERLARRWRMDGPWLESPRWKTFWWGVDPETLGNVERFLGFVQSSRYWMWVSGPLLVTAAMARFPWEVALSAPVARWLSFYVPVVVAVVSLFLWFTTAFSVGLLFFLRPSYAFCELGERRQMLWIVEGCLIAIWATLLMMALSIAIRIMGFDPALLVGAGMGLTGLAVVLCFALAIFYRGALEPGLAIRATTLYGALALLLTSVFVGLETLVSAYVVGAFGLPEGAGGWVSGTVIALLFGPLRARVERRTSGMLVPDGEGRTA